MSYFNHAFQKAFVGTSAFNSAQTVSLASGSSSGSTVTVTSTTGLLPGMTVAVTAGTGVFATNTTVVSVPTATTFVVSSAPTTALSGATIVATAFSTSFGLGQFGFIDPNTGAVPAGVSTFGSTTLRSPLVLVSGSIHGQAYAGKDKIGPFHGGYTESVKSKIINPRFVSAFYRVDPCPAQQSQVLVGENTNTSIPSPGACSQEYLCGETYSLRVDIKGSPALRTLTRNSYYTATAYTGCCATTSLAPTAVNPLIVYVNWAYQLLNSPLIGNFIQVQITYSVDGGNNYLALGDGTNSTANLTLLQNYVLGVLPLPANATPSATRAGLIIDGAYVDTRFGDCTFYPNDSIVAFLEPVQIFASEVDLNGDPCAFNAVCISNPCRAVQQKGTGENVIRSLILTQAYSQDPFYTGSDLRIREITNGPDVYATINRNASYTRYYIQHNVPRYNNPTGVFDNDQYLLEIIATPSVSLTLSAAITGGGTGVVNASNAINFSTANVATGYIATITFTPPGSTSAAITAGTTVTVVAGTSITIAAVGAGTIPAGSVITFQPAYTANFEAFVNAWLFNANNSIAPTATTALTVYNCNAVCARTPTNP